MKYNRKSDQKLSSSTLINPHNCHKQEIDIERLLIWTYQKKQADKVSERRYRSDEPLRESSSTALVMRMAKLGTLIDCSGSAANHREVLDEDADTVHAMVQQLGERTAGHIISNARTGMRPDVMEGQEPRLCGLNRRDGGAYDPSKGGKPRLVYHDNKQRRPSHCPLVVSPCPKHLAFWRGVYRIWWDAMARLVLPINEYGLEKFIVTGPAAPAQPWKKDS